MYLGPSVTLGKYPPQVTTEGVSSITTSSATLTGNLDSTGALDCQVWFEYGITTSYGSSTSKLSKSSTGPFSAVISSLNPDIAYHFRARAQNSEGTSYGSDMTFKTETISPRTWYVDDDKQDYPAADFTKIQDVVDAAGAGDTIIVYPGTYTENVDVNKDHLTIESQSGAEKTIVQAANVEEVHVFGVTADYVTIKGFTVKNASGRGIALSQVEHCIISYNKVQNSGFGVWLYLSSNNTITSNTALDNGATGIHLTFSSNNIVTNNVALNNTQGIYLYCSSNNTLINNRMLDNQRNFFVEGWELSWFIQDIDTSNKVNGKPMQYLVGKSDLIIDSSWDIGYLGIINCTNITVKDLTLDNNNGQGVLLAFSSDSRIEAINVSNNLWGIDVCCSSYNTIANNAASNNMYGIRLYRSSNNTVIDNTTSNNEIGIHLYYYCSNNTLANNIASDNGNGILLLHSCSNTITNNTASNNGNGIQLYDYSCGNALTNNTASKSNNGIYLCDYSSDNILTNNAASNNYLGVFSYRSSNNTLTSNTALANYRYGILLRHSDSNKIYLNNFINNWHSVYSDDSTNTWNSPEPITYTYNGKTYTNYLGNYWGDYTGSDTDGDGIGDTPYVIDLDKDGYLLMEPFENYKIGPDTTPPTVVSTSPEDGAINVAIDTVVTATFSEAMSDPSAPVVYTSPSVGGSTYWSNNTMTFRPTIPLAYSTTYAVTIGTNAQDLAGNPLATPYTWSFTTESALNKPPSQPVNLAPADGATGVNWTFTLESSAFLDPDPGDYHTASQWQLTYTPW